MAKLTDLLFPNTKQTTADLFKKYPPRKGAALRLAPSPTGFLHIGGVGMGLCDTRLAKTLGGIAYLRIEDTDQKREVEDARFRIQKDLQLFGVDFDEYDKEDGTSVGRYGPYTQSKRVDIYHVFAKHLVEIGRAYPCFCTADDLSEIRAQQDKKNERTGYQAGVSRCQKLSVQQAEQNIRNGKPWVLRFDTTPDTGTKIEWNDLVRGKMSLPAEENHPVIIKSNGLPPYNFAHVVDDTLMRTSHIVRGEEWLISAAEHIQIARAFGKVPYEYLHMPTICVLDNGSKRKLSKRKDKEALAKTFLDLGYPIDAVTEYLLTLYNTGFEKWRMENPTKHNTEFVFQIDKIGTNNPLFDWAKLDNMSKEVISKMTCEQINKEVTDFFKDNKLVMANLGDLKIMLAIGRESDKPRKDIAKYSDVLSFYDFLFGKVEIPQLTKEEKEILAEFRKSYDIKDDKEIWLNKVKDVADKLGFALNTKDFKSNPNKFKGTIGDVTKIISKATIGREQSPDLYTVLRLMNKRAK